MAAHTDKPCPLPSESPTKSFWHKDPSPLLLGHRSTRNIPVDADVVIVGSGITGASIAHYLLNKAPPDLKVVMLEAREACWGATGRVSNDSISRHTFIRCFKTHFDLILPYEFADAYFASILCTSANPTRDALDLRSNSIPMHTTESPYQSPLYSSTTPAQYTHAGLI